LQRLYELKEATVSSQLLRAGFTAFLVLMAASSGPADEPKKGDKKDDQKVVDSKAQKRTPATAVNFHKELGLSYGSLGTLGSRIETARRSPDPVALAHAASELATAEKVSGKKASLTSQEILKESQELAKLRREISEMKALLHVSTQMATEETTLKDLKDNIDFEQKRAKDESDAILKGMEPTGAPRKVLVNNYTTQIVDLYVNGTLKMQLQPGQSKWCVIEHKWDPTILKAYGSQDEVHWGPRYIWGNFDKYTWNLN